MSVRRGLVVTVGVMVVLGTGATAASAVPHTNYKDPGSNTTLDACGYFSGTQTSNNGKRVTNPDGTTSSEEHGAWTGVSNNFPTPTLVASVGPVTGKYAEATSTDQRGNVIGTETFTSKAGNIDQSFSFGPDVSGGFSVSVTATGALSFLTSDTNGQCYQGPVPRP